MGRTHGRDWCRVPSEVTGPVGSQAEHSHRATPGPRPHVVPGPHQVTGHAGSQGRAGLTRTQAPRGWGQDTLRAGKGGPFPQACLRPRLPSAAARGRGAQPVGGARSPSLVQTEEASRRCTACRQPTDEAGVRSGGAQGSTAACRVTLFPLLSHQHPAPS